MGEIKKITTSKFLGKVITVYGSLEEPLFLAKEVAEWIDYDKSSINKMVNMIDDDEKIKILIKVPEKSSGGLQKNTKYWFLTYDGLYEILFRTNKPEAKEFKKEVKRILRNIRKNGYYISTGEEEGTLWLKTRNEGKQQRRIETDAIKEFVRYAKQQGSTKPEYYYKHFTTLVYDRLDIPKGLERDKMEQQQLLDIQALERVISMKLNKTLESSREMNYKEVYQTIKTLINDI